MRKTIFLLTALLAFQFAKGQEYFPKNDGVKTQDYTYKVFVNAIIHVNPERVHKDGVLIVRNGKVVAVGENLAIPRNAQVHDMKGTHLYPSFIELNSDFGIKKANKKPSSGRSAQYEPSREGYYWNDHILSDYNSLNDYNYDKDKAEKLRKMGVGVVLSHRKEGIHRGTGMAVGLSDAHTDNFRIISEKATEHFSFKKSKTSNQSYPSSVMGAMALIRQLYHDAAWYGQGIASHKDLSLEAVNANRKLPKIFEAGSELDVLRGAKVSREMNLNFAIKASGYEYEQLRELTPMKTKLILPLNFPKPYDVANPLFAKKISLQKMRRWNQAPANPSKVDEAGISFAFTTSGVQSEKTLFENLRKVVRYGLSEAKALAAFTTVPAEILGMQKEIGTLEKGAYANFMVMSGSLFEEKTKMYEHWVHGLPHIITNRNLTDIDGHYETAIGEKTLSLSIKNSTSKIELKVKEDTLDLKSKVTYKDNWLYATVFDTNQSSFAQLTAKINSEGDLKGEGVSFKGDTISWQATRKDGEEKENSKEKSGKESPEMIPLTYPNTAYGFENMPTAQTILFKNATVWTNEAEGILKNTDVLVADGKIKAIGKNLSDAASAQVIDATGKHLTSGIIDEHSHIAASSINEGGQNSSAEVSIEDVIDPNDIDIYRNLSGGVTTIQILHGSANPIGGRSAIIKLKWGAGISEMLYEGAAPFIKFALGENVKQSNWNSYSRFPQTRMGVEQVFEDYFQRAKEYGFTWQAYNALSSKQKSRMPKPRYDMEMEALWQILKGERFISCHSYVQSEINMLMKVADRYGFKVNTFTHILEGYKVADKMKAHGVGGSTFSDWWAYKYEVNDAIPYNGPIMHEVGVTVAYNSDDAEMSRRLNQEAAKAIKYGGVSEEDAWKFVTLNPAKLLHIDDAVGSVKVGKSADLVLWSDHPMSIYAIAEKTIIEGAVYYDASKVSEQLETIASERRMLTNQMLDMKKAGVQTQAVKTTKRPEFFCETLDE